MNTFVLYNYFRSSASYRVRIALNLKQIKYEYKAVHLVNNGGEQHAAEYVALNPSHVVPTLVHNGKAIGQSVAIIEYIDKLEAYKPLYPAEPYKLALVRQAIEIVNSGIQPHMNLATLGELTKMFGANEEQKHEWIGTLVHHGLAALERHLKPQAGKFCFGDEVTAADCFLIPQIFSAERFKVSIDQYPTLKRINTNCLALEEFAKAHPNKQPDTPA